MSTFSRILLVTAATSAVLVSNALAGNNISLVQVNANFAEAHQACPGGVCNNNGVIFQNNTSGTPASNINVAVLNQAGSNSATIEQIGAHNSVRVDQGPGNTAEARQLNHTNGIITINQNTGSGNYANAKQSDGSTSVSLITQLGNAGQAYTVQDGVGHAADIRQGASSSSEYVHAQQHGTGHWVSVKMGGQVDFVFLAQHGSSNNLDVTVANTASNSITSAYQEGVGNNAKMLNGNAHTFQQDHVGVHITQKGNGNYGDSAQLANAKRGLMFQEGNNNNGFLRQYEGASEAVAHIQTTGNSNDTLLEQFAANQEGQILQTGNGNDAIIQQGAPAIDGHASVFQNGMVNSANINQISPNSRASINQTGAGAVAIITQ